MMMFFNKFTTSYKKNIYRYTAVLWIILIFSLVTLTCNSNSLGGNERFFAENHEVQLIYVKDFSFFSVVNLRGNIAVTNTESDSIKISVDRFASSALNQAQAELYLDIVFAQVETVIQDSAFYRSTWQSSNFDQSISVDLIIEIPGFLNLTTNNLTEGHQIIDVAVPRNNSGNLFIINNAGNIDLNLYQSNSFIFSADIISGIVEFDNLNSEDFNIIESGSEVIIQRVFNEGTGRVIAALANGTLNLIGKN